MNPFIVENAINTCYIDSLLFALFYKSTLLDGLLNKDLKNTSGIYLQEYVKERFVKSIRNGKSILKDDIEMIRVICSHIGWQSQEEYLNQQDVSEFYCFLMDVFEMEKVSIQRNTIIETSYNNQIGKKEIIPFIPLYLSESDQSDTIKNMLSRWQYDNIAVTQNTCLNSYNILNEPIIIGLAINRFNNKGTRIQTNVIIQKKIYINEKRTTEFLFHSAICHRGDTLKSGHYYTLVSNNNSQWYIFDDLNIPCIKEVKMDDPIVTNMIKKECIFAFYKK
ncbi:ubiquitin carboxyl-terminal hydrolase [Indivirus ILV1]|uniref:ubiquitinyl hydrolase 1 n=1 Tax=Indivirus ILV1 TaxID=1977633 RepID=A0A1V0SD99_9VIRU|nr:ubiquitin carboxyl-terminal hydrolase [Indivirus ILV1]